MSIQVKIFGSLADEVGATLIEINGVLDSESVIAKMLVDYPRLKTHKFTLAYKNRIVTENIKLQEGDLVALLPPFAGG